MTDRAAMPIMIYQMKTGKLVLVYVLKLRNMPQTVNFLILLLFLVLN